MDGAQIYYTDQNLINQQDYDAAPREDLQISENKFIHFIRECQVRNSYIYRDQLRQNSQRGKFFLRVEMEHLIAFDDPLVTALKKEPHIYLVVFEKAV